MFSDSKRIFDVSRLKSFAGYTDGPVLQDHLDYFIPPFHVISSRLVVFGKRLFELWSPNSTQMPFYPGVQDPKFKAGLEAPLSQRQCNGHIGRFDPTTSPQHYNPQYPWLHLIRRLSDGSHPEHEAFLTVWQPTSTPNRGSIRPSYIQQLACRSENLLQCILTTCTDIIYLRLEMWDRRQLQPSPDDIKVFLQGDQSFDHAVDNCTRVQRGLKVMSAWICMAHLVMQDLCENSPPSTFVPEADDSLVGVWLNGTTEEVGLWLLRHRVPCFIIHEVEKDADNERVR